MGFNNTTYNKAVATFEDYENDENILTISMPKPVANLPKNVIEAIQRKINKGRNPAYIVNKITQKQKPGGNGTFDDVDYTWKY